MTLETFGQMVFLKSEEAFIPSLVADSIRSGGVPSVQGDLIIATYGNDASGKSTMVATRQIAPDARIATWVSRVHEDSDPGK